MRTKLGLLKELFLSMRPLQWAKNMAVFSPVIFAGYLFNATAFRLSFLAFLSFCAISSASYIFNDLIDAPLDRLHPLKKNRPIARKAVSPRVAITFIILLFFAGLDIAFSINLAFSVLIIFFFTLHIVYSLLLKKTALWDILAIALSFILRAFGGEVASGYHLPVWLMFAVVFLSLFIASGKRRSEAVLEGRKTRPALKDYRVTLLDFYLSIFAVATLISYSLFTYLAGPQAFTRNYIKSLFGFRSYLLVDRKWLMLTVFPVIFGIMKYAQIVFHQRIKGEQPEKLLISNFSLLLNIIAWGAMIIFIIYA